MRASQTAGFDRTFTGGRGRRGIALAPEGPVMQKTSAVVGLALVAVLAASYQFVIFTEARTTSAATLEEGAPSVGVSAAVVPLVPPASSDVVASMFESVSDAAVLGLTGAVLWLAAAGVRAARAEVTSGR